MPKITKIKMTGFCNQTDYAVKDTGVFIVKSHRPSDIKGVYKATTAYQLELDKDDMKDLRKPFKTDSVSLCTDDIVDYYRKQGLLPKERLFIYGKDWRWDYLNRNGFITTEPPYSRNSTATLIVFAIGDFVKCEPTKKEKEIINALNNRSKMQNLNKMVVADNIIKVLKDNKYEVDLEETNHEYEAFFFHDKKAFNTLIKDALEYYLNNIVLKDIGCKIKVPNQKSTHCYKYDDVLCYVGDIELTNKGE